MTINDDTPELNRLLNCYPIPIVSVRRDAGVHQSPDEYLLPGIVARSIPREA